MMSGTCSSIVARCNSRNSYHRLAPAAGVSNHASFVPCSRDDADDQNPFPAGLPFRSRIEQQVIDRQLVSFATATAGTQDIPVGQPCRLYIFRISIALPCSNSSLLTNQKLQCFLFPWQRNLETQRHKSNMRRTSLPDLSQAVSSRGYRAEQT